MTPSSMTTLRPRRSRASILLVEERGSLRKLLRQVLEEAGWDVHTATEILAALTFLAESDDPVDLVVADASGSNLFGGAPPFEELAEQIRKLRPECRVMFVSDNPNRVLPHPRRPWIRHLPRPFNLDELVRSVDEALSEGVALSGVVSGSVDSPPKIDASER